MGKGKVFFWIVACILFCCGCGAEAEGDGGRYVETTVELPGEDLVFTGMVQEGESICLLGEDGRLLTSGDGGRKFAESGTGTPEVREGLVSVGTAADPEGNRVVSWKDGEQWGCTVFSVSGGETEVSGVGNSEVVYPYWCGGSFYVSQSDRVYRLDASTGNASLLLEGAGTNEPFYLASDGKLLYVVYSRKLVIYDLEQGGVAGQDEVLEKFLHRSFIYRVENPYGAPYQALLYPCGETVYVADESGIYRHTLYGEDMEQVVEGGSSFLGASDRRFTGLSVTEGKRPEFMVCYTDGRVMNYAYDADAPEPVTLRVYSLRESDNVKTLISSYRKVHPEVTVEYQVGYSERSGMTVDDALKNIATELAAGTAADILVMDDLPYDSYVEKGALLDLASLREGLAGEAYYTNVIDSFAGEEGMYTMPLAFAVPILAGKGETLQGLETLTDLADLLVETRKNVANGEPLINLYHQGYMTLNLLAEASQGAWVTAEGSLDMDAIGEFLTQGKRIYDTQLELNEEWRGAGSLWPKAGENEWDYPTKSVVTRRFGCYSAGAAQPAAFEIMQIWPEQPFLAGYLSSMAGDFPYFSVEMDIIGFDYCMMPGQKYGACLALDMMSVNRATGHREECMDFLEYAFSEDFQRNAALDGTPVNKAANKFRYEDYKTYPRVIHTFRGGREINIPAFEGSEEVLTKFESLLESVSGVNYCETKVFDIVMEGSEKVVAGEASVEEALAEIERQLKLYLAE